MFWWVFGRVAFFLLLLVFFLSGDVRNYFTMYWQMYFGISSPLNIFKGLFLEAAVIFIVQDAPQIDHKQIRRKGGGSSNI